MAHTPFCPVGSIDVALLPIGGNARAVTVAGGAVPETVAFRADLGEQLVFSATGPVIATLIDGSGRRASVAHCGGIFRIITPETIDAIEIANPESGRSLTAVFWRETDVPHRCA